MISKFYVFFFCIIKTTLANCPVKFFPDEVCKFQFSRIKLIEFFIFIKLIINQVIFIIYTNVENSPSAVKWIFWLLHMTWVNVILIFYIFLLENVLDKFLLWSKVLPPDYLSKIKMIKELRIFFQIFQFIDSFNCINKCTKSYKLYFFNFSL